MDIRSLEPGDERALQTLFDEIPDQDRGFFKEDLDEPSVIRRWIDDDRGVRLVTLAQEGRLGAVAAVWPGIGRSSHVGELRLVVATSERRRGLGRLMARAALVQALRRGIWKITVEVVAREEGTIDMFRTLGFAPKRCCATSSVARTASVRTWSCSRTSPRRPPMT